MKEILIAAALAAFAVSAATDAAECYQQANDQLGWDFFMAGFLTFVALLLVIVTLASVFLTALYYQKESNVHESPSVIVVCLLPAGIGLMLGGAILLYRGWQRFRETAGWI